MALAPVPCPEELLGRVEPAIAVVDLPGDELCRARAQRLIHEAGRVAIEGYQPRERQWVEDRPNLLIAIQQAAEGDAGALKAVEQNVTADVVERSIKAGHVMEVQLTEGIDGDLVQYGQRMADVLKNALAYVSPEMRARTEAEARNGMRMRALLSQGWLDDYCFVVISRYPDDMTDEQAGRAGFFTDTKTCAIQVFGRVNGRLVQESAFVAGAAAPGAERHDDRAVGGLLAELGIDLETSLGATALLDYPLLVPRSRMPHGVADLVEIYDEHAGGTFFGQDVQPQEYAGYREVCRERERQLAPTVQHVTRDLLSAATRLATPLDAVRRLHVLSQAHLVDLALVDAAIDPRVFGSEAALHIVAARESLAAGDNQQFEVEWRKAQSTARSSSCPIGFKPDPEGGEEAYDESSAGPVRGEWKKMKCPYCGDGNQYGDPCSPNQHCTNCNARVIAGKVVSEGDGGKATRERAAKIAQLFRARPEATRQSRGLLQLVA